MGSATTTLRRIVRKTIAIMLLLPLPIVTITILLSISTGTYNNSTGIATANTNNARCIKIFGVYFRNVDGLDLNKSVSIENRCSKNVENEVKIDARREKEGYNFQIRFIFTHI